MARRIGLGLKSPTEERIGLDQNMPRQDPLQHFRPGNSAHHTCDGKSADDRDLSHVGDQEDGCEQNQQGRLPDVTKDFAIELHNDAAGRVPTKVSVIVQPVSPARGDDCEESDDQNHRTNSDSNEQPANDVRALLIHLGSHTDILP